MDQALDRMHKLIEELDALKKKVDAVKVTEVPKETELSEGKIEEEEKKLLEDIQQAQRAWAQPDMCNCVPEEQQRSELHIEYSKRAESYWSKLEDAYKGKHIPKNDLSNKYKEMDETLKLLSLEIDVEMFNLDTTTHRPNTGKFNDTLGTREEEFVDLLILIWKLSIDIAALSGDSHNHNSKLYNFIINEDRWQTDLKTILCFLLIYTNDLRIYIKRKREAEFLLDLEYYYARVVCVNKFLQLIPNAIKGLEELDVFKKYNSSEVPDDRSVKDWWSNLLLDITNWIYQRITLGSSTKDATPMRQYIVDTETLEQQNTVRHERQKAVKAIVSKEHNDKLDNFESKTGEIIDSFKPTSGTFTPQYDQLRSNEAAWRGEKIDSQITDEIDSFVQKEIKDNQQDKSKLQNILDILRRINAFDLTNVAQLKAVAYDALQKN